MVFIVPATLILLGLYCVVRGMAGRRCGSDRRCKKCDYNLTGLLSERCPECGMDVSGDAVVIGDRRRDLGPLIFGVVLLLMAGAFLGTVTARAVRTVDWYRIVPFFKVFNDARSGSLSGYRELERRFYLNELSTGQFGDLADACLQRQSQTPAPPRVGRWLDMLDELDCGGHLTPEQQQRYYDQLVAFSLKVRPQVLQSDPIPFQIRTLQRGPARQSVNYHTHSSVISIGDVVSSVVLSGGSVNAGQSALTSHVSFDGLHPGLHPVTLTFQCDLTRYGVMLSSREVTLNGETTILADNGTAAMCTNTNPAVKGFLEKNINAEVRVSPSSTHADLEMFSLYMSCPAPLPADLAFEVVVVVDGEEILAKSLTGSRGYRGGWNFASFVPTIEAEQVFVILRSAPELVAATVDLFDCWRGEITLGPIEIKHRRGSTRSK